jgi:hypothetical protein
MSTFARHTRAAKTREAVSRGDAEEQIFLSYRRRGVCLRLWLLLVLRKSRGVPDAFTVAVAVIAV